MTDTAVHRDVRMTAAREFARFYDETVGPLSGYAFQLVGDAELAADIVQESYTRLLARWIRLDRPRPYLFRVATNLAKDAWESRDRRLLALRKLWHEFPAPVVAEPDHGVRDAVARLSARHQSVVLLYYYADLPLQEVAAAVRRPQGTVKRLLSEARVQLAESLGGCA